MAGWSALECIAEDGLAVREHPVPVPRRLFDRVRDAVRSRHMSRRTEEAYLGWIRRYILFHEKRHPSELGASDIGRFLSWLATERHVAAPTQNQALSAILFLYRVVLGVDVPWIEGVVHARVPRRLPVVLDRTEVRALVEALEGTPRLVALLLYGAGLRLLEALHLRVKDVDLPRRQLTVRSGKGDRDRLTVLPAAACQGLTAQLASARRQHEDDIQRGHGWVELPAALDRKYPRPAESGVGSGSSRRRERTSTATAAGGVGITRTRPSSNGRSMMPYGGPTSGGPLPVIPFGIRSPRTFWKTATTFAQSRSSSATRT